MKEKKEKTNQMIKKLKREIFKSNENKQIYHENCRFSFIESVHDPLNILTYLVYR